MGHPSRLPGNMSRIIMACHWLPWQIHMTIGMASHGPWSMAYVMTSHGISMACHDVPWQPTGVIMACHGNNMDDPSRAMTLIHCHGTCHCTMDCLINVYRTPLEWKNTPRKKIQSKPNAVHEYVIADPIHASARKIREDEIGSQPAMCQVHTDPYVSLLAPEKPDYTACHTETPTTNTLLPVAPGWRIRLSSSLV